MTSEMIQRKAELLEIKSKYKDLTFAEMLELSILELIEEEESEYIGPITISKS
jgi:hypothetical protein